MGKTPRKTPYLDHGALPRNQKDISKGQKEKKSIVYSAFYIFIYWFSANI